MANQLKMAEIQAILALKSRGWSNRRIAVELGVDRETVGRYVRLALSLARSTSDSIEKDAEGPSSKPANAPAGSEGSGASKPANALTGDEAAVERSSTRSLPSEESPTEPNSAKAPAGIEETSDVNAARAPSGSESAKWPPTLEELAWRIRPRDGRGRDSQCEPYRQRIEEKLALGLSAQRVYQDLVEEGFAGSVYSVQRFVRRLLTKSPEPFRRMECLPGEEAQVDFGTGAPVTQGSTRRRTHVFRILLSHSRKAYSEAVFRQTTESFVQCLENAFWYFGGVPRTLVLDNLKAAVQTPDWFDPETNPKLQSLCAHYGTALLPTKPYTPRHKGKIESGIGYVKKNGLKGRVFASLEEQNQHLRQWEQTTADRRIHGTTKRQVGSHFEEVERAALIPLPSDRFPFLHEARRSVHRDGHVEVAKAYYSVPPEYVGRIVWARWDERLVRIFNGRMEQIALHSRQESGRFSTTRQHLSSHKISMVEEGAETLLVRMARIGPKTGQWAEAMFQARGIEGVRVLVGMASLARKYPAKDIEAACDTALSYGAFRLRTIRQLIGKNAPKQQVLEFLDEHPIIRPMSDYGALVHNVFDKEVSS